MISQETKRNPSAFYARLRAQEPLSSIELGEGDTFWVATNYDDAIAILKDRRFVKETEQLSLPGDTQKSNIFKSNSELFAWRRDMLMVDPPDHTRLRNLVSKAFTPRMIEQLRPRIQQITNDLLDAVQNQGQMDLISDFAFPLPITVISEMLGIPVADRPQFRAWTRALLTINEQALRDEANASADKAFYHYIKALLAEKREHPGSDLISNLLHAEENGDVLNENELISTIFLLIVAGHETTVNLIGNGVMALLQFSEQKELLQHDATLLPSAIEELLRYTSPVTLSTPRWASEDIVMHDKTIHKGDIIMVSLAAANTDPQQFPDPDLLDITRQENQQVAFGKGIHYCLGAPLARLEAQIAIGTLLQRLPHLRLAKSPDQLHWIRTFILRGLTALPVTF
ncbi:MAG TPA: cytochrome P450 [Ktedonobacteraceae bacterium]|nr:cytochrome P450 [Ktedonobacteraceae bacterium]